MSETIRTPAERRAHDSNDVVGHFVLVLTCVGALARGSKAPQPREARPPHR